MISLKDIYGKYFRIGAAVNENTIVSCKNLILEHFNSLTCENAMKYGNVCDINDNYDFSTADAIYNFACENNIPMRGHALVWHQEIPTERFEKMTPEQLKRRISKHMEIIGERYPKLYAWDVLNEAIDDKHGDFLRDTVWKQKLGNKYYLEVFDAARNKISDVPLFYNDYNEVIPEKCDKIFSLCSELATNGLIDGVGFQCHLNINQHTADDVLRALDKFSGLGVKLHITELDISMIDYDDLTLYDAPTAEMIEKQADLYEGAFKAFRDYSEIIESVTFWCVSDENSWLNYFPIKHKNWPLPFNENHKPKEAFYRIAQF